MNNFFKTFLASLLAFFAYSVIIIVFGVVLVTVAVVALGSDPAVKVTPDSLLTITLDETVEDRVTDDFFSGIDLASFSKNKTLGLNDILACLKHAAVDENIKGIYLELGQINASLATVDEIRDALTAFKESGKFIYCHADSFSQKAYFLATVADYVYLTPTGTLDFTGFSMQVMYYKNALEKLGIEPQIIRYGKYKSAVEPFILGEMSGENRTQLKTYIDALWGDVISKIADRRKVSPSKLNAYADGLSVSTAEKALEYSFIDGVKYMDEVTADLARLLGSNPSEAINYVYLGEYIQTTKNSGVQNASEDSIAVIYATGAMEMGEGDSTTIGSAGLSRVLWDAREDPEVKAIVLRINSPGGDALAAEIILREVKLAQEKKPVVVSMGEYAASGGYYIACGAGTVIAAPHTLTGSIGVYGMYFSAEELLTRKIGVTVSVVNTNAHSDIDAFYRVMTAEEKKYAQTRIENIYSTFIGHVAEGRDMTVEQVDALAQGRIWSGSGALEIGLVDGIGGLEAAVKKAAELAELETYRIVDLPRLKDPFSKLFETFSSGIRSKILLRAMGSEYTYYAKLQEILASQGIQARIPYSLELY